MFSCNFSGTSALSVDGQNSTNSSSSHEYPCCKSPARMQRHLEKLPPVPFEQQLIKASDWVKGNLCYDEKILCIGQEIPAKLQDGPQCGIVSLWMAGQFLDPSNDKDVADIQDKAIEMQFTKHGEMFSAKNMVKLAKTVFNCEAEKVKGSYAILSDLKKMLNILAGEDEKLIMVPYDSAADQWPSMNKGHKAHWGVIFGLAIIKMPCKNKAFDNAKILDGYVSYLKPPLSQDTIDAILDDIKDIKFLLMVRQSKSKRVFFFNSRRMADSNNNLDGYSMNHRHHELFMHDGFVMPPGGLKSGLKGKLVFLKKKTNLEATETQGINDDESSNDSHDTDDEDSNDEKTSDEGDKSI